MKLWIAAAALFIFPPAGAAVADTGEQLFNNNCAICHQVGGVGVPGQFPRLAGRAGQIAANPRGRDFLSTLVLSGMSGTVVVGKARITGVMPDFSGFEDADLATVLTYVTHLGGAGPAPFTAADIKAARERPIPQPTAMAALHAQLQKAKVIP